MIVLGIEASCDDTSVALVDGSRPLGSRILALCTYQQMEEHQRYQGVVPEVAARSHVVHLPPLVRRALEEAQLDWSHVSALAATLGPGLIGGVIVGSTLAKTVAMALQKPFIGIHHMEGHLLTVRLTHDVPFPFLALLASGGHTQLVLAHSLGHYTLLGRTRDDALGECFDKAAKVLDLGYPGGPHLERLASQGQPGRFSLPRPLRHEPGCDFSFSGLKTSIRHHAATIEPHEAADLAADFQEAVADVLVHRLDRALSLDGLPAVQHCVFAGGVSANIYLRKKLQDFLASRHVQLVAPPLNLCTDNGAMIAWAGYERFEKGWVSSLDMAPKPRWSLEDLKADLPHETA